MRTNQYILAVLILLFFSCKLSNTNPVNAANKELAALFDSYWEERMKLFPLEATALGDNRYNDLLPIKRRCYAAGCS
jgi:hypothetical protein